MIRPLPLKTVAVAARPLGRDSRVRRTLAFFARKGFLRGEPLRRPYLPELQLADVLWVCEHVAPELYEILPVARLRFPGHLGGPPPEDLELVLGALRAGARVGPAFRGHPYWKVRRWLALPLKDGRCKGGVTTRVQLKLPPALLRRIWSAAAKSGVSASALVAKMIDKHLLA